MKSLEDKISLTYSYFDEITSSYPEKDIVVAWTGGKDSTCVLYLWHLYLKQRKAEAPIKAIFIDTGFTFPEIYNTLEIIGKKLQVDLETFSPRVDLSRYPKTDVLRCCRDLKVRPLHEAILKHGIKVIYTGVRGDETPAREERKWKEPRDHPPYLQINPILHWRESDVWTFHIMHSIPYCELYNRGYRSIDCIPCTSPSISSERDGRNPNKEKTLSLLHSMGYF